MWVLMSFAVIAGAVSIHSQVNVSTNIRLYIIIAFVKYLSHMWSTDWGVFTMFVILLCCHQQSHAKAKLSKHLLLYCTAEMIEVIMLGLCVLVERHSNGTADGVEVEMCFWCWSRDATGLLHHVTIIIIIVTGTDIYVLYSISEAVQIVIKQINKNKTSWTKKF